MVSPISSASRRFCPALDQTISATRCVSNRITAIECPLSCPFNPFNPSAPKAFDAVVGRGLTSVARWLEKTIGHGEWGRRFDAMDRRFLPERDLALISFESQWSVVTMALAGEAYPEVRTALSNREDKSLRNDARIVLDKLAQSRALLVEVTEAADTLPYYAVRDALDPQQEYLYVDFGDQEPLEEGSLMFGRFLVHENCLYVIPGVFVGTQDVKQQILDEIQDYLEAPREELGEAMQNAVPEIWNLCAAAQDERDERDGEREPIDEAGPLEDPYRTRLSLLGDKSDAMLALRDHPIFEEIDPPEFGIDPFGESVFEVYVNPEQTRSTSELEEEDTPEPFEDEDDRSVRVGSVLVSAENLEITALNPVELELVKALVKQLVLCE